MKSIILFSILVILLVLLVPREIEGFSPAGSISCGPGGVAAPGAVSNLQCTCPPNAYLDPTRGCVTCADPSWTVVPGATRESQCSPVKFSVPAESKNCGRSGYCFSSPTECIRCNGPNCPEGYFWEPNDKECVSCLGGYVPRLERGRYESNPFCYDGNGLQTTAPPGSTNYRQCTMLKEYKYIGQWKYSHC